MLANECIMTEQPPCRTRQDWDRISGNENLTLIQAIPYTHNKFLNHLITLFELFCMAITFKKSLKP